MKSLCWNCRGLGQPRLAHCLVDMVRSYKPQLVSLIETKMNEERVERIRRRLGFTHGLAVDCQGRSGGLAIWWADDVDLTVKSYSMNHIDCIVDLSERIHFTVFYGNPVTHRRSESWNLLRKLSDNNSLRWLVLGDFNEILFSWEKVGRRVRKEWQMQSFRETVEDCGLMDLGYFGIPYTFSNRQTGQLETRARLDRAFANLEWKDQYSRYDVKHLVTSASDHFALLHTFKNQDIALKESCFASNPCGCAIKSSVSL
ncbi:unnamed protein product [Rhodiola kirilowii]